MRREVCGVNRNETLALEKVLSQAISLIDGRIVSSALKLLCI